jgi:hypothetical protein
MVKLTDAEQAMLEGDSGAATQKAMELLIRYADALGAERFVETNNVAGVPGSAPQWIKDYYKEDGGDYRAVFSRFDLDSDEVVDVPRMNAFSCHLQGGMDPMLWQEQGMTEAAHDNFVADEASVADHGQEPDVRLHSAWKRRGPKGWMPWSPANASPDEYKWGGAAIGRRNALQ